MSWSLVWFKSETDEHQNCSNRKFHALKNCWNWKLDRFQNDRTIIWRAIPSLVRAYVYVCMYVCICTCRRICRCICIRMCICNCICIRCCMKKMKYVCMYCECMYVRVRKYVYNISECMYVCIYVCMNVCMWECQML